MANKKAGDYEFRHDGNLYIMRFGALALSELEERLDKPFSEILRMLEDDEQRRIKDIATIFWASLRSHHPEMDDNQSLVLLDEIGLETVTEYFGEAFQLAFPSEGGDNENPPVMENRKQRRAKAAAN